MAERILIISASMGAGHDGAARELARRLEADGHATDLVDFLACLPGLGGPLKRVYQFQLDHAPWSYEAVYQVFFKVRPLRRPLGWLVNFLANRRVRKLIAGFDATCVVTTYALASLVLGRERQRGRIAVPTATFVTDFAVHPLWVHAGVDENLCVHPSAAAAARQATGKPSLSPGPLVPARFNRELPERAEARHALGIPPTVRAVLVVAGSWGVGDLEATFDDLGRAGGYFPVVACGANDQLRESLAQVAEFNGIPALVLGWTDRMAELMAACDVLLQNAGGLTCMEAFAAGLPVLTYRPIPGHGVENALAMEAAGVAPYVREHVELIPALERALTLGGVGAARHARSMFAGDAARDVLTLAASQPVADDELARRRSARSLVRGGVAAALLYGAFTVGADAAVAHGVGVAKPPAGARTLYLGVRLGGAALIAPGTPSLLARSQASAVVSGPLATIDPSKVQLLANSGVNVANGGWGNSDDVFDLVVPGSHVGRGARAILADTGAAPGYYVPASGVSGYDLSAARLDHEQVVHPNITVTAGGTLFLPSGGQVVLVDASHSTGTALAATLQRLVASAHSHGLSVVPYAALP